MLKIWSELCEPEHLIIIVLVLVVALLLTSAGGALGGVISAFLKKVLGGKDVQININGGDSVAGDKGTIPKECEGSGLIVDPSRCAMHQSEHERSIRNESQIANLWEEYGKLRNENLAVAAKLKDEMVIGFAKINDSINTSNTQILSALAGSRNGFQGPGRRGSG
jgi:hypothetical protein